MKCGACGYEYLERGKWVDKVTYYKSGKNKGNIKTVEKEWLDYNIGHTPFKELGFDKQVDELVCKEGWSTTFTTLFACPECGTVKIEV